jgi:hypothetical protein
MSVVVQSNSHAVIPARLMGRAFGPEGLARVRELAAECVPHLRSEIARRLCERLGWINRSGKPALLNARVALVRLHQSGLLDLPAPRNRNGNRRGAASAVAGALDFGLWEGSVEQVQPIVLAEVQDKEQSKLWNGLMVEHHYLGGARLAGAQIRYLIYARGKKGSHNSPGKTRLPPKQVWVYRLEPHFRARLCAPPPAR